MTEQSKWEFADKIEQDLEHRVHHTKLTVEKLAAQFGITDRTLVKELTELAIVRQARKIIQQGKNVSFTCKEILDLYESQVTLSHRTSQSILLQQYSTPAPISYMAGVFAFSLLGNGLAFEPSAGNGLLTIALPQVQ